MLQPATKPQLSRSESTTAQVGTRPPSDNMTNSYRNTSIASTASSVGSTRPSSRQTGIRQLGGRPPSVADTRPVLEEDEPEAGVMGKRKGTPTMSFFPLNAITVRKRRTSSQRQQPSAAAVELNARSQHSGSSTRASSSSSSRRDGSRAAERSYAGELESHQSLAVEVHIQQQEVNGTGLRNVSLCTQFADLSLTPTHEEHRKTSGPKSSKHRPSLSRIVEEKTSPSKIPKYSCTPKLRHVQSAQVLRTPSPLKHKSTAVGAPTNGLRTPASSARRGALRDEIPIFLTKEKLTSYPAWDTKGRLEDMEQMYVKLRTDFAAAADSKNAIEESLSLYKSQGMPHI